MDSITLLEACISQRTAESARAELMALQNAKPLNVHLAKKLATKMSSLPTAAVSASPALKVSEFAPRAKSAFVMSSGAMEYSTAPTMKMMNVVYQLLFLQKKPRILVIICSFNS